MAGRSHNIVLSAKTYFVILDTGELIANLSEARHQHFAAAVRIQVGIGVNAPELIQCDLRSLEAPLQLRQLFAQKLLCVTAGISVNLESPGDVRADMSVHDSRRKPRVITCKRYRY